MTVDRDALRAWLEASCAVQGVPVFITDASLVTQVGILLGGRRAVGKPPRGGAHGTRRSQSPRGDDALRGEGSDSLDTRGDGSEVENGPDDRVLP